MKGETQCECINFKNDITHCKIDSFAEDSLAVKLAGLAHLFSIELLASNLVPAHF